MKDVFKKMTADYFFSHYVQIPNWRKKMAGKNTNGNPICFTESEQKQIKKAWPKYLKDLQQK